MTASPNSARGLGIGLCVLLALTPAAAQTPLTLTPPAQPQATPAPPPARAPQHIAPGGSEIGVPARTPQTRTDIEVATVGRIDPDSVGLLTAAEGGFTPDLWRGSPRPLVERLMARLRAGVPSPVYQGLARRLLLSQARAPEGAPSERSLLALRVERLAAMGEPQALTLLAAAPEPPANAAVMRIETELRLLGGDEARACLLGQEANARAPSTYWQTVLIVCQAIAGRHDAAALGRALLREVGGELPSGVDALVGALADGRRSVPAPLGALGPLHMSLLRAGGIDPPLPAVETAAPALLLPISEQEGMGTAVRIRAAERAEAMGIAPSSLVGRLYAGIGDPSGEGDVPATIARARAYQAASREPVPFARAERLQAIWTQAREGGYFAAAARIHAAPARALAPSAELLWVGADALRALLAAHARAEALAWYRLAAARAAGDAQARTLVAAAWPLMRLAAPDDLAWDAAALAVWLEAQSADAAGRHRAELILALFEALGETVDEANWQALVVAAADAPAAPDAPLALMRGLADAAAHGRLGETVLLALLSLGEAGPAGTGTATLATVIGSLRQVGLEEDARALALEAAISAGL